MKRGIITNNEQGIHISDGEVWMTSWEIADLFYTTAGMSPFFGVGYFFFDELLSSSSQRVRRSDRKSVV